MANVSLIDGHIDNDVMTDEQIIKGLEYKINVLCDTCDIKDKECCTTCVFGLAKATLDLINRQKAEIERLRNALMGECMLSNCTREGEIKAEAIKEFAERFREKANITCKGQFDFNDKGCITNENISTEYRISQDEFDEILKEMVGDVE